MGCEMAAEEKALEPWRVRLKAEIDARGISYTKLSKDIGGHDAYVSRTLQGKTEPSMNTVLMIMEAAGIDPAAIFMPKTPSEKAQKVLDAAAELDDEEAQLVVRLLDSTNPK
ncbi:hypothetical protein TRM7615_04512 [Falsiruegeria mediterranea M17]|uniref:HTH cro/C1-type domain-containing protein n=2 Tax=Falsiruegeria TaxID=2854184 RepID=A0A2R8CEY4_9RHOB|nr:hypothetical protein TRM7615_04512 [Falsiruegeria mediterranea M17]